ncbi:MAG: 2Fe-2S iron-sulfur cluster-binding protein, partial [Nitrospinota bacterium]
MSPTPRPARRPPSPAEEIDREARISFRFDGRSYPACRGDTIASALYAAGVRVLSRSFKYHRPRGLFCVSGNCPNCLVEADGEPSVRACTTPVREGMEVRGQNAWPSVGRDVLSVVDRLDAFLPPGFYYRRFHRPRWMWPLYDRVLRRMAGLGRIDVRNGHASGHDGEGGWEKEHHRTDLTVV